MKIWIEVELHSDSYHSDSILAEEWLSYEKFSLIEWTDIWVKLSREYYGSTIEYNFTPFDVNEDNFNIVVKYLNDQIRKFGLVMNDRDPRYVGTHIHIFTKEYFSLSYDALLKSTLWYILDNADWLSDASITRLAKAHQLWTYWSHINWWEWFKTLKKYWIRPQYYDHHCDTKKYSPIFASRATKAGKPKSLEIRCIPNEFIFNWKAYEMMKEIEAWTFLNRRKIKVWTFVNKCFKKLWIEKETTHRVSNLDIQMPQMVRFNERLNSKLNYYMRWCAYTFWEYAWELVVYKYWEPLSFIRDLNITDMFMNDIDNVGWNTRQEICDIFEHIIYRSNPRKTELLNLLRENENNTI